MWKVLSIMNVLKNSTYQKTFENIIQNQMIQSFDSSLPSNLETQKALGQHRGLRGTKLKEYHKGYKLSGLQKSILVGTLLGDGTFSLRKSRGKVLVNVQLKCEQINYQYIACLYTAFQDIIGTPLCIRFHSGSQREKKTRALARKSYYFKTYTLPLFTFYSNEFYAIDALGQRRKQVPKLIHRWLTPEALAIWFQDDGTKEKNGYSLATHGFYRYEVVRLQHALRMNFGLHATLRKDKVSSKDGRQMYKLGILKAEQTLFTSLIQNYVVPSMQYKLHMQIK